MTKALNRDLAAQAFANLGADPFDITDHASDPAPVDAPQVRVDPAVRQTRGRLEQIWLRLPVSVHRALKRELLQMQRNGRQVSMQDLVATALSDYLECAKRPSLPVLPEDRDLLEEITKRVPSGVRLDLREAVLDFEDSGERTSLMDLAGRILWWWAEREGIPAAHPV